LGELVLNLDLHLVGAKLGFVQHRETVVLRHHLTQFPHLLGVGCLAVLLHDAQHPLGEHRLHFPVLRGRQVRDGRGRQIPRRRAVVEQNVAQPRLSRPALHLGDHHVDLRATLRSDLGELVRLVLAVALAHGLQHDVLDGPLGKAGCVPALAQIPRQPEDHRLVLTVLQRAIRRFLLLLRKIGVTHHSQKRQTGHPGYLFHLNPRL
jgi:hypothetical protein